LTPFAHRILFVRHGETSHNAEGRLQGQRDIALNGKGREQANSVGRALRKSRGADLDRLEAAQGFFSSPLARARETMQVARAAMGLTPERFHLSSELRELSFGDWEGLTWPEVEARDPLGVVERRADIWNFVPPNGESYAMLEDRLKPWLATLTGDALVVSHGGVARALMRLLARLDPRTASAANVWQGRALVFEEARFVGWGSVGV
jgi:broad specificity phosphatase PhoE